MGGGGGGIGIGSEQWMVVMHGGKGVAFGGSDSYRDDYWMVWVMMWNDDGRQQRHSQLAS